MLNCKCEIITRNDSPTQKPMLDVVSSRRAAKKEILANGGRSAQELVYLQDKASKDSRKSYPLTSAQKDK